MIIVATRKMTLRGDAEANVANMRSTTITHMAQTATRR
jgi:hypothetical protein